MSDAKTEKRAYDPDCLHGEGPSMRDDNPGWCWAVRVLSVAEEYRRATAALETWIVDANALFARHREETEAMAARKNGLYEAEQDAREALYAEIGRSQTEGPPYP